jgi:DNA-binding NarL/FixJ family response regulator
MRQGLLSGNRRHRAILPRDLQPNKLASASSSTPHATNASELQNGSPSPRERQVLYLLSNGKSNKEIGLALDISTRTVEFYRARIMLKLDLHSTAALVRYAIRNNIVEA